MSKPEILAERGFRAEQRKQLNGVLHNLCQPVTTLQCRLEMAILSDSVVDYREAAETGMTECRRIVQLVESMRAILQGGGGSLSARHAELKKILMQQQRDH